jgi:hypothetical protein
VFEEVRGIRKVGNRGKRQERQEAREARGQRGKRGQRGERSHLVGFLDGGSVSERVGEGNTDLNYIRTTRLHLQQGRHRVPREREASSDVGDEGRAT